VAAPRPPGATRDRRSTALDDLVRLASIRDEIDAVFRYCGVRTAWLDYPQAAQAV